MGNSKWEMGKMGNGKNKKNGKWEMGKMGNGKWEMKNGKCVIENE